MGHINNVIDHDEVKRLLKIAKRHLDYINKSKSKGITIPGLKPDHGIVASIFSAAAIEVGFNLYITVPLLNIENARLKKFFGTLLSSYTRTPISQKLNFICHLEKSIGKNKFLLKRVRNLLECRNSILHSSPKFLTPLGAKQLDKFNIEIPSEFRVTEPTLLSKGVSSADVSQAFEHYQTALDFLGKLKFYAP